MNAYASLYLDTRRPSIKHQNKFPVKVRVTFNNKKQIQIYYSCKVYLNQKEFERITKAPRKDDQSLHNILQTALNKAISIINKVKNITPKVFDQLYHGSDIASLSNYMSVCIKELEAEGRAGYMLNYTTALNSFEAFNKGPLYFNELTTDWLTRYEKHMLKTCSITTIGMYMRALRAVINKAIHNNIVTADIYPFGKGKYQIKTERKIKFPLTDASLIALKEYTPANQWEQRAIAFWFFSYYSNGMNMIDILNLRHNDIVNDYIIFDRNKTRRSKTEVRKILIPMRPELQQTILLWGKKTLNPKDYLFDVVDNTLDPLANRQHIKDFTKRINRLLKKIGFKLNIPNLKFGIARHPFANKLLNSGISTDYLQYALGHSNITTTEHYKGSFALERIKEASGKL